ENEINSILQDKKINDELRGITRPDLPRHISDDIDSEVVDTLLKTVTANFDISKDFYKVKAKAMRVEKLEYHERNVEVGEIKGEFGYEKSVELVYKVLGNLDSKFGDIFKMFVENGQIDVFPKKGKRGGAFCTSELKSQPTYILLNHTNKLNGVLTLAHEVGHGINNELMRVQNALNFDTPLSTAEVASTFFEDFVLEELLQGVDEKTAYAIKMQKLNDDISTIIRQVACYNFELELHKTFREVGYLSKNQIGEIFTKNMSAYMGDSVEQSKGSENWWVYWGHIRSFFYVYSYASGLLISKALQRMVRQDKSSIEKVKKFLSLGESKSPKEIFAELGIDITDKAFWQSGLDEVRELLNTVISS
ncbi:MAG: M3 family metallopeptidase, partial [bacterium]|nr:M3 family metallopeptidase [bacterium]